MLSDQQIHELVNSHGRSVSAGRSIAELISDGELPRLKNSAVAKGKVSDSVYGEALVSKSGRPLRLMFRNNRISTHDVNRGAIPFKDQVLAINHDLMLTLLEEVLGSSQFKVAGLRPTSTVIPAENLTLIALENVLRLYNAESSTSTSLFQHWQAAKKSGQITLNFAGHQISVNELSVNGRLPYVMDTPSTKAEVDHTTDARSLVEAGVCSFDQYTKIRNSSLMAFGIVSQYLVSKGMVLVDTKTEHGINQDGKIVAADELYTMDSSRFWRMNEKGSLELRDGKPVSFSKEFARGMVTEVNQQFTEDQANEIAVRYIQGLQHLTGEEFSPDLRSRDERIVESTNLILDALL
ncbi:MAG TPA: phosphoribosylaminoimidazolesuccinocarboxamide synthase [Gammaproteobacteria bacterium]|nr:phosphoribosylaminoimidazolesuccinocarboxamide synthase [Gammaproteobacteria bacterium]